MSHNFETLSMKLTSFIYQYKEVNFLTFSQYLNQYPKTYDDKTQILLLFFLVLKNEDVFNSQINKISFSKTLEYKLSLVVLKSLNLPNQIYDVFFDNIKSFMNKSLYNISLKQTLFDISSLFSNHEYENLFFDKNTNVSYILQGKDCFHSYLNLFSKFSLTQKKQVFNEAILNFRVSSIFIFNHLYDYHPHFFRKKILLSNMNIFSQCKFNIILFDFIKTSHKKDCFKLGANLSFSSFNSDDLKDFFNDLFLFDENIFYLLSSGFISNPKQNFPDIIEFLKKKNHFNLISKTLKSNHYASSKQLKI